MQRVAAEMRIVFLLLDALRDGFLVTLREITRYRFAFFLGFGALEDDGFLHRENGLKGPTNRLRDCGATPKLAAPEIDSAKPIP